MTQTEEEPETEVEEHTWATNVSEGLEVTHDEEVLGIGMRRKEASVNLCDYVCITTIKSSTMSQESRLEYRIENFVKCRFLIYKEHFGEHNRRCDT